MTAGRSVFEWREILCSPEMRNYLDFLAAIPTQSNTERILKLKSQFPAIAADIATVAFETAQIRNQFSPTDWQSHGFFLQSRKEQSTRPEIARYHATHFAKMSILEIGSGIGFDTAALAEVAKQVTAIDTDSRCCAIAEHNLRLQGLNNVTVVHSSLEEFLKTHALEIFEGIWADPGRRHENGERIYDPELYHPPLSSILSLATNARIGIKVSPALNIWELSSEWHHEMIGWEWSCPEQILWKNNSSHPRQATLVDASVKWHRQGSYSVDHLEHPLNDQHFLLEPHPALVRTNECEYFFAQHTMSLVDPHLSFGVANQNPAPSPWYRCYRVKESFRYSLKVLKGRLKELQWDSRTQIKKRGVREQPDEIHRALKLPSPERDSPWGFVILLKVDEKPQAILAERVR